MGKINWDVLPTLWAQGVSANDIAARLGCQYPAVNTAARKLGLAPRQSGGNRAPLKSIPTPRLSGLSDCNSLDQATPASPRADRSILGGEGDVAAVRPPETVKKTDADIRIPAPEPSPVDVGMHRGGEVKPAAPVVNRKSRPAAHLVLVKDTPRWRDEQVLQWLADLDSGMTAAQIAKRDGVRTSVVLTLTARALAA